jgi:hypothetical protein
MTGVPVGRAEPTAAEVGTQRFRSQEVSRILEGPAEAGEGTWWEPPHRGLVTRKGTDPCPRGA